MKDLKEKIRIGICAEMEKRNISYKDIAVNTGISIAVIKKIFTDADYSYKIDLLDDILYAIGISIEDIFNIEYNNKEKDEEISNLRKTIREKDKTISIIYKEKAELARKLNEQHDYNTIKMKYKELLIQQDLLNQRENSVNEKMKEVTLKNEEINDKISILGENALSYGESRLISYLRNVPAHLKQITIDTCINIITTITYAFNSSSE